MAVCLPGLQGFPIQVTGWNSEPEKDKFVIPNDISLQFSPGQMPMSYQNGSFSINGTNTFFMGGSQYFVRNVRICQPKQDGLITKSAKPIAELHIWGLPTATSTSQGTIALLNIPIFQGPVETTPGEVLISMVQGKAIRLQSIIPTGKDVDVMRYTSCVETSTNSTISFVVGYWSNGMTLTQEMASKLPRTLVPFGVPQFSNYTLLTSYVLSSGTDGLGGKGGRNYQVTNGILQPYSNTVAISASTKDFMLGFRYIRGFTESISTSQDTGGYKCIAIDRSRDIKNGKLLVDASTGKRLTDEVADADAENDTNNEPATISPRQIMETICIILGVILGLSLLSGLTYLIYYMFVTRKSLGIPPVDPSVEALAAKLGPQAGS